MALKAVYFLLTFIVEPVAPTVGGLGSTGPAGADIPPQATALDTNAENTYPIIEKSFENIFSINGLYTQERLDFQGLSVQGVLTKAAHI